MKKAGICWLFKPSSPFSKSLQANICFIQQNITYKGKESCQDQALQPSKVRFQALQGLTKMLYQILQQFSG